jgi:RNA polymerase sigma-70 factor (ECF subfamily)
LTDAQLIGRAKLGDSAAWQMLYERLLPSVWRAARTRLSDKNVAEDIVSDAFHALIRNLDSLDAETCSLHAWLFRVVQNKINDCSRRQSCHLRVMEEVSNDESRRIDHDPADLALAQENRELVVSVLEELRTDHRMVLELKYVECLSVREIAVRMDQSEKGLESLLYRARVEFRNKYELRSKEKVAIVVTTLEK